MCSKSYNAKAEKEGEIEMNSVTVKDLMQDQEAVKLIYFNNMRIKNG